MNTDRYNITLRRFRTHPAAALMSLWGIGIVFMALHGLSDGFTTWHLPVWEMELPLAVFITIFLCVWFGFAFFWIWMTLRPLQTVRLDGNEVMICFGPLVLRRMEYERIKTVVRTDSSFYLPQGRSRRENRRLILSEKTVEELVENAGAQGWDMKGRRAYIMRYMRRHRRESRFYLEWTREAELVLREQLTTSVFVE